MHSGSRRTALALAVLLAFLAVEAAALPIGIDDLDEGYFVQQGLRVLHAQVPFRDFQTLYAPGLAYVHATLFSLVGGPYVLAPRVLALAARAALALLLFAMTRPLVSQPLWAAFPGVFLLLGLDDAPVRWEPHPGWLSTVFAALAAWCLSHRPDSRWLASAGATAGLAYVFKQNTGAFILLAIVIWAAISRRERWRNLSVLVAAFAATTAPWGIPLVVATHEDLTQLGVLVGLVDQAGLFAGPELPILVPLACLLGGLWLVRRERDPRLGWYVGSGTALLLTEFPRMDTLHLAWSAPLLLVSGAVALDRLRPALAGLILVPALAVMAPNIMSRLDAVAQPQVAMSDVPYTAGLVVPETTRRDLQGVVAAIQARTQANEPIFVYPTSPLLYALSERPNPTRFDHLNPGAANSRQIAQVIADLQASAVRLVVISDFWAAGWGPPGPNVPLVTWLSTQFSEVARYGSYRVLVSDL